MKRIAVAGILTMLVGCTTYTPARTTTPAPTVEPTPTFVEPTPTATPTAEPAPEVTQFFESFRVENGTCIWEMF